MNDAATRHQFDRRMFLAAAITFPLLVLIGFASTYYARPLVALPALPSTLVYIHGLLMTAWVALFVVQVRLISAKRIRLHQRLGYAGIGLAGLIIVTGIPTALRAGKYGSASFPPDIPSQAFLLIPVLDLLLFALFFGGAVYYRRRAAPHKRLMLLTAVNFLPPAIARLPIPSLQAFGPLFFFGLPSVLLLLCVWLDAKWHGRVSGIFLGGSLLLIGSYVGRLLLMGTATWMSIAGWLTSFV
jgi:hypothetical protein